MDWVECLRSVAVVGSVSLFSGLAVDVETQDTGIGYCDHGHHGPGRRFFKYLPNFRGTPVGST